MNFEVSYIDYLKSLTKDYNAFKFLKNIPIDSYIFYDIGVINNDNVENNFSFGSIRSDMGIGFTCDLGQIVDDYYDFEKEYKLTQALHKDKERRARARGEIREADKQG